jgi:hypothetical protein
MVGKEKNENKATKTIKQHHRCVCENHQMSKQASKQPSKWEKRNESLSKKK